MLDLETDPNGRPPIELRRPDLVAVLSRRLEHLVDASHATAELVGPPGEAAPIDDDTRARLRALGYLE